MRNDTVVRFRNKDEVVDPLTQLLREGAQRLLSQAVSAELELFLDHHGERRDGEGRRAVVRNGYLPAREMLTGSGRAAVDDGAGHRAGDGTGAQGTGPLGRGRVLPFDSGAAVCTASAGRGGGTTMAVFERGVHWQHAGGAHGIARGAGAGIVGVGGLAAEGRVDQGV